MCALGVGWDDRGPETKQCKLRPVQLGVIHHSGNHHASLQPSLALPQHGTADQKMTGPAKPRVLVIGAGFAGGNLAVNIASFADVTLVDK
jgi:hypothetical protein